MDAIASISPSGDASTSAVIETTISKLKKRLHDGSLQSLDVQQKSTLRDELIQLKKQSRLLHEEAHIAKENVAALRKAADSAHLALQSVHYEKKHLEKELTQILATEVYDTIEFATPEGAKTTDRKAAMNDKLQRVKNEVDLRQGECC